MRIVTPVQMKKLEEKSDKLGFSYSKLMDNAGLCLAEEIKLICHGNKDKQIFFLCGNGNNGGDCFVASAHLAQWGYKTKIGLLCGNPKTEISISAFEQLKQLDVAIIDDIDDIISDMKQSYLVADGVFGTGFHGQLDSNITRVFKEATNAEIKLAVDVPSGGNCCTGQISEGTFNADYTVTFAFCKTGMTQYPLKGNCGKVIVKDIGIPESYADDLSPKYMLIDDTITNNIIKKRNPDSHKGRFGKLLCLTGSLRMSGAGIMAAMAALRCGVGIVSVTSCRENIGALLNHAPEVIAIPMGTDSKGYYTFENIDEIIKEAEKCTAVLIGCGLGVTDDTVKLVKELIKKVRCPIILDADGINCISNSIDIIKDNKSGIILTPHPGEFAGITGKTVCKIQSDRLYAATEFSQKYEDNVLVLKGAGTIVAVPDKVYVNTTGNPGMSKGGSGDILSGMTASFAAQGISLEKSAVLAVYMHGLAGDKAEAILSETGMLPTDMINELPELFRKINKN